MSEQQVTRWWKESVVYQIYPASFRDSTGDGVGDLVGISSRLDYIKALGVDIVWVCPFYQSPQADLGYDVSDYTKVHEPYGTVKDAEDIIKGCHERGMKAIFDLVINHTSDQHKWFLESRSSKTNPKRDFYMWKPAKLVDGVRTPPNNWRTCFGGSVWEWDELTEEYYLHYFCPEQPDLNWECPEARKAAYNDAILFWLEKGLDGFRIDTVNMYSKHLDFPDAPVVDPTTPWQPAGTYFCNGPRLHEFLREMRKETFSKYDTVSIGELPNTPVLKDILSYISVEAAALDLTIQFDLQDLDKAGGRYPLMAKEWSLPELKKITVDSQVLTEPQHHAWAVTYLENHDQARAVSRFGSDAPEHRVPSAKMLATYLLTLSGTTIIYQGQELGMINMPKEWSLDEYKDVSTVNMVAELREHEAHLLELGRAGIQLVARDHARTPMHWDSSPQAGFSTNEKTWMKVMDSYLEINAEDQENDKDSSLAFYRFMLALRKREKGIFVYGSFHLLDPTNEDTMVFEKRSRTDDRSVLVVLNFSKLEQPFVRPASHAQESLLFSTVKEGKSERLAPFEARVYMS